MAYVDDRPLPQREKGASKTVLLIAPHPDDELLLGGGLLVDLLGRPEYDVHYYIATNGDYLSGQGGIRIQESVDAITYLGGRRENIHFGGFGDNCKEHHWYDSDPDKTCPSFQGKTETYVPAMFKNNEDLFGTIGLQYTRNNHKSIIRNLLVQLRPSLILCVGQDSHPDHKALSLLCEECVGELAKDDPLFRPAFLTKFVYPGVFFGKKIISKLRVSQQFAIAVFFSIPRGGGSILCTEIVRHSFSTSEYAL